MSHDSSQLFGCQAITYTVTPCINTEAVRTFHTLTIWVCTFTLTQSPDWLDYAFNTAGVYLYLDAITVAQTFKGLLNRISKPCLFIFSTCI